MRDINELWDEIRAHPDFAGGALFTRANVTQACFGIEPGFETPADVDRVTEQMMRRARATMESYLFAESYTWIEAMADNVPVA